MEDGLGYLIGWSSQYLASTIVCVPPFRQKVEVYTFPFHWTGYCYWTLVILLTLRSYLPLHLMKQRCFLAVVVKRLALINRFVVPNEEENVQLYVTVKFWDSYTVWHCVTSVPCLFHSLWSNLDLALWKNKVFAATWRYKKFITQQAQLGTRKIQIWNNLKKYMNKLLEVVDNSRHVFDSLIVTLIPFWQTRVSII